jgi:hypothetical protein
MPSYLSICECEHVSVKKKKKKLANEGQKKTSNVVCESEEKEKSV